MIGITALDNERSCYLVRHYSTQSIAQTILTQEIPHSVKYMEVTLVLTLEDAYFCRQRFESGKEMKLRNEEELWNAK